MHPVRFEAIATDGAARTGIARTARGSYRTPCFMPVGTRGAIKYLSAADYESLGAEIVLGNTYHLMLRPGAETVAALGGLGRFAGWNGLTLTDSGGFQVFSLDPDVDDDGVTFKSTYDGSTHRFTPEVAVTTQELLGADIQMVLDVCPSLPSPPDVIRTAVDRTAAWATTARKTHHRDDQALFGIVQAAPTSRCVRRAQRTVELDFDGYGIGGLSVGETRSEMVPALVAALVHLPTDRPRYLMGVGDPASLVDAVAVGVDQFDCVMQTRIGRHGTAMTAAGKLHIKNAKHAQSDEPLDAECKCDVPATPHGYIRHPFQVGEPTAALVSLHNVSWTPQPMEQVSAIQGGTLDSFRRQCCSLG
jgi:queuine tRNA-ribosyltransferase